MKTLKKRSEFLAVAKGGRTPRRAFLLQACKTREDGAPRMGYTVTKKTGNSVERSRIKRRLRSAVAKLEDGAGLLGADYVLIGRRAALSQPFDELLRDLRGSLKQAFSAKSRERSFGSSKGKGRKKPQGDRGNCSPPIEKSAKEQTYSPHVSKMSDPVDER
ncbi:ribonuclease P protein component [Polycladidibacter hongkongensis]|uniref:ribonuclease P protein component n=1 Tax=Polycladidibacter hongkongensis TaxID=1647556 RepID=UPI0009E7617D|nr:ribonuclease P protein component [Pseudovibrio hongkongensis]